MSRESPDAERARLLIIEDEVAIRTGLIDVFVFHGYAVDSTDNGTEGLRRARTGQFDLVLLDVMLPGMNGFDVCEAIRESNPDLAVIMLTAKSGDPDIVNGLRLGADDYVAKPFSVEQLVLRVGAVLRRTRSRLQRAPTLQLGGVTIDADSLGGPGPAGEEIRFTRREIDILQYLAAHATRPVSREALLSEVWGYAKNLDIETRTVDIHIAKLRRKIEPDPSRPRFLLTVRGAGYRLMPS